MRWARHVIRMREMCNTFWLGNLKRKASLVRPWPRSEDNIKISLTQIGWTGLGFVGSALGLAAGSFGHGNESLD